MKLLSFCCVVLLFRTLELSDTARQIEQTTIDSLDGSEESEEDVEAEEDTNPFEGENSVEKKNSVDEEYVLSAQPIGFDIVHYLASGK